MEDNITKLIEEMTFEELVAYAKTTDDDIEELERQKKTLEESLSSTQEQRTKVFSRLLTLAKEKNLKDERVDNLFVTYFSKEDITWLDDAGLLKKLQENKANDFIKVTTKVTTSIDKNALKKAFKSNDFLREAYKDYYGVKLTEYVTVTTIDNHKKMLEHIESNGKENK